MAKLSHLLIMQTEKWYYWKLLESDTVHGL